MQITMPIWMLIGFLAASAVAGLALALWWVDVSKIRKMEYDISHLLKREEIRLLKEQIKQLKEREEDNNHGALIMNDKVYDTSKSVMIASGCIEEPNRFFPQLTNYIDVKLWKTKKGNYFFVRTNDGNRGQTVTFEQAKDFLKKNDYDAYIKEFGELEDA